MAPKIATYSVKQNDVPVAYEINRFLLAHGETYTSEPSHESPDHARWQSELLIPYKVRDTTYAFLGPFRPANLHPEDLAHFFHTYQECIPRVCVKAQFDLGFLKADVMPFRSSPPSTSSTLKLYAKWLDRVQSVDRKSVV